MKSCLIIDDSEVLRQVTRRMLEHLKLTVDEASDQDAALDRCRQAPPDAIVLDHSLSGATGVEFLRELRGQDSIAQPLVLYCTAESDPREIRQALDSGADEILMKPFDRDILASKLSLLGVL